jgi:hypothetical protein
VRPGERTGTKGWVGPGLLVVGAGDSGSDPEQPVKAKATTAVVASRHVRTLVRRPGGREGCRAPQATSSCQHCAGWKLSSALACRWEAGRCARCVSRSFSLRRCLWRAHRRRASSIVLSQQLPAPSIHRRRRHLAAPQPSCPSPSGVRSRGCGRALHGLGWRRASVPGTSSGQVPSTRVSIPNSGAGRLATRSRCTLACDRLSPLVPRRPRRGELVSAALEN